MKEPKKRKYLNKEARESFGQLFHLQDIAQQILEKTEKYRDDFVLTNLKYATTYFEKFLKEDLYPRLTRKEVERLKRYENTTTVVFMTKNAAREKMKEWKKTKGGNEKLTVTRDYLEDLIVAACNGSCKGCKGKEECDLKKMLELYDAPATKMNPKNCKYELPE